MRDRFWQSFYSQRVIVSIICLCCLIFCSSCGANTTPISNAAEGSLSSTPSQMPQQVLTFPNVGTQDIDVLDPAQEPDANSVLAMQMIYSGLVRTDKNLNIIPDQASWEISHDKNVYTFHLRSNITFSDGTPVNAQTYIYSWTRALKPALKSPSAAFFTSSIVGASAVINGKSQTLSGVKALDPLTLQITLSHPASYFIQMLANPFFYPVNSKIIEKYGQTKWISHVEGMGVGTGPFVIKEWQHNIKMVFEPNPRYYGVRTQLDRVNMVFANDPATAFKYYRAGQYNFIWNMTPEDQVSVKNVTGFVSASLFQTEGLFFNIKVAPFDNPKVRQAFAYATDRQSLVHSVFKDAVPPADTLIPNGIPGHQTGYQGQVFDKVKAKTLLQSVYPDLAQMPPITFSFSSSIMSANEAGTLQNMWQQNLGIKLNTRSVEQNAYTDETNMRVVQFGAFQWNADFADPYDFLGVNLLSGISGNIGNWSNTDFDQTVQQAEQSEGAQRLALYNRAEQIALDDSACIPLHYGTVAAVIPPKVHGVSINGAGLYFGDWSEVSIS